MNVFLPVATHARSVSSLLLAHLRAKHVEISDIAIVYGFIGLCNCSAFAEESFHPLYNAEGVIREEFRTKAQPTRTSLSYFNMALDDQGRWKLSVESVVTRHNMRTTHEIAFNGADIFSVLYSNKRFDQNYRVVANPPPELCRNPAVVARGPFPLDYGECVGTLWLGFLAGEYVVQHPTNQIPNLLVANARETPFTWTTDFRFKLLSEAPNPLISYGSFNFNSNKASGDLLNYPEVEEPENAKSAQCLEAKLRYLGKKKEVMQAEVLFSLEDSRMVGGRCIPTRFSSSYVTINETDTPGVRIIQCEVTNVHEGGMPSQMLPALVGNIDVQDRRFEKRTRTGYLNSIFYELDGTGWIVSTNDKRLFGTGAIYNGALHKRTFPFHVRAREFFSTMAVVVLAGLAGIPIFLIGKALNRKSNPGNR